MLMLKYLTQFQGRKEEEVEEKEKYDNWCN